MRQLRRHLSVANVLSCMALFVALSGVAYAATSLGKNSVKTRHLAKGAVTTQKLRNGAVNTSKLRNRAVSTAKIRNKAVVGEKLANGAVGSNQILDGAVRSRDLGGGVVTRGKLKDGAVDDEQLAGGAVGTDKIANNAVTTGKIGADAVTTGKLQDGAVTAAKLAPSFNAQLVKNVSYVTAASPTDNSDVKAVTAECPAGKQVTGGGARFVPATFEGAVFTVDSFPALNAESKRSGWSVSAREVATADPGTWTLESYAICAEF